MNKINTHSIPSSYDPISKKNSRSMEKAHPTCVGIRIGAVGSLWVRFNSLCGTFILKNRKISCEIKINHNVLHSKKH